MPLFAESVSPTASPLLGVLIFVMGGLAGALFYLPFKKVKGWAWESYWFIFAVSALIVVPWVLAFCTSPNVIKVLHAAALQDKPRNELGYCCLCGAMWGVGGLTWGLMIRYLGVGLGLAIGCGICSAAGTLIPPVIKGNFGALIHDAAGHLNNAGLVSLGAVLVSIIGIIFVGGAGMSKEKELTEKLKKAAVAEYNFKLGLFLAAFSGLTSAAMNFGLQGGGKIEELATTVEPITSDIWKWTPVLVVVLFGGFVVNAVWCLILNVKNKTTGDYVKASLPLATNFLFAALAGFIWCMQMISLKTGEPVMGPMSYVGWSVLFSGAILFSTVFGVLLGEWRGTSPRTRLLLTLGLLFLVASSVISGYSGHLKPPGT